MALKAIGIDNKLINWRAKSKQIDVYVHDASGVVSSLTSYDAYFYAKKLPITNDPFPDIKIKMSEYDVSEGKMTFDFYPVISDIEEGDYLYEVQITNEVNRITIIQDKLTIIDSLNSEDYNVIPLTVTPESFTFTVNDMSTNVNVETDNAWSLITPWWITASELTGVGDASIVLTKNNSNLTDIATDRNIFHNSYEIENLDVSFYYSDMSLTPLTYQFNLDNSTSTFNINTDSVNQWWIENIPDWLDIDTSFGSGNSSFTLTLNNFIRDLPLYNITVKSLYYKDITIDVSSYYNPRIDAIGGEYFVDGLGNEGYYFIDSSEFTVNTNFATPLESSIFVVAGGGGGGGHGYRTNTITYVGGGGGGGELVINNYVLINNNKYNITIGNKGIHETPSYVAATDGGNSSFHDIMIAVGGGRGGGINTSFTGGTGGSGGGGAGRDEGGSSGTGGTGLVTDSSHFSNAGGDGNAGIGYQNVYGGGGGGASSAGGNWQSTSNAGIGVFERIKSTSLDLLSPGGISTFLELYSPEGIGGGGANGYFASGFYRQSRDGYDGIVSVKWKIVYTPPEPILPAIELHAWNFDNNMTDSIGTQDLFKENPGSYDYVTGLVNEAIRMDVNANLACNDANYNWDEYMGLGKSWSFSGWVKANGDGNVSLINNEIPYVPPGLGVLPINAACFCTTESGSITRVGFSYFYGINVWPISPTTIYEDISITYREWNLLNFVFDGVTRILKVYVNNNLVWTYDTYTNKDFNQSQQGHIGRDLRIHRSGSSQASSTIFDQFKFFQNLLTVDDVSTLWNNGAGI